jgi:hypothetical protein
VPVAKASPHADAPALRVEVHEEQVDYYGDPTLESLFRFN